MFKDASNNDILFIQKLCKTVTGLRIEDWTQNTICYFSNNLLNFKKTVEEYNKEEKVNLQLEHTDLYLSIIMAMKL